MGEWKMMRGTLWLRFETMLLCWKTKCKPYLRQKPQLSMLYCNILFLVNVFVRHLMIEG